MAFFPDAENVVFNNAHFEQNHNNQVVNIHSGRAGIDILCKASTLEAAYDGPRAYVPRCFPRTRKQFVEDLIRWAIPALGDTPSPIYWMRGPAGVGKSAIAQTCAEKLQHLGKLGATFFFSIIRGDNPAGFFPSIAYQLSTVCPAYRDLINMKISHDEALITKGLSFQFQYLINKPLRELGAQGTAISRFAVLIDGLDECEEIETQHEIIRIVATTASDGTSPLCWAFFSRPDSHIEAMFSDPLISPHCHKVFLPFSNVANKEIELYLRSRFEAILRNYLTLAYPPWLSDEDMASLVSASDGSFMYATIVVRYVENKGAPGPQERLSRAIEVILDRRKLGSNFGPNTNTPFAELDAFYKSILRRIPKNVFPSVHLLLALICRRRSSGAIITANLLGLSKDKFEAVCSHANAVVHLGDIGKGIEHDSTIDTSCSFTQTSPNIVAKLSDQIYHHLGGKVSFYHKSFTDFLLDPTRSGDYCVRNSGALARHFAKIHLNYDRSFSAGVAQLVLARNLTDSASSLSYPSTNELANSLIKACVYRTLDSEDSEKSSASGEVGLDLACDFRKHLYVVTHFARMLLPGSSRPTRSLLWGCECRFKCLPGTYITFISRTGFSKFSVPEFKQMIKQREQANIIQPYNSSMASQFKSIFYRKSPENFESAAPALGTTKNQLLVLGNQLRFATLSGVSCSQFNRRKEDIRRREF